MIDHNLFMKIFRKTFVTAEQVWPSWGFASRHLAHERAQELFASEIFSLALSHILLIILISYHHNEKFERTMSGAW